MKDVIEVLVAGSWMHVEAGSFRVVPDPLGGGKGEWFEFTIGDAQHKTARGPVESLQVVLSRPAEGGEVAAPAAPKRATRARAPKAAAPKPAAAPKVGTETAAEAVAPAPRTRRRKAAEPEAS